MRPLQGYWCLDWLSKLVDLIKLVPRHALRDASSHLGDLERWALVLGSRTPTPHDTTCMSRLQGYWCFYCQIVWSNNTMMWWWELKPYHGFMSGCPGIVKPYHDLVSGGQTIPWFHVSHGRTIPWFGVGRSNHTMDSCQPWSNHTMIWCLEVKPYHGFMSGCPDIVKPYHDLVLGGQTIP